MHAFSTETTAVTSIFDPRRGKVVTFTIDIFMKQVETYTTFKIASFIDKYWFPVLIPIGVLGNILSFYCNDETK